MANLTTGADGLVFLQTSVPGDTFTQLLGINDFAEVAGYHNMNDNQGLTLTLPDHFTTENFPGSMMTQVVGINNLGETDGFYVDQNNVTHGFIDQGGRFQTVDAPDSAFNQLLGVNDFGEVAGYSSTDPAGQIDQRAFLRPESGQFDYIKLPTNVNSQATGVNDFGTAVGFYQPTATTSDGFIDVNGKITTLSAPGSTFTQALGINNFGEVVGSEVGPDGNTHGFIYQNGKYTIVDAPNATSTVINGVNDFGIVAGFSTDATTGNTNGFVAAKPFSLSASDLKADLLPQAGALLKPVQSLISGLSGPSPGWLGSGSEAWSNHGLLPILTGHHG